MDKFIIFTIGGILVVILIFVLSVGEEKANPALDAFARCLSEKGLTMYGADWCPHCQNEKRAFGGSFKYVRYVECPKNPKLCLSIGIEGYPTWILKDGTRLVGEQGLEGLARASGCVLSLLN